MKKSLSIICSSVFVFATSIAGGGYITQARVIETTPIVETVYEDVEVCRYRYERTRDRKHSYSSGQNNTTDKVIGGVIGGAAGSAVGKGSGRDAAAGIGALFGSEIADGDGITSGELIGGVAGGLIGNQIGKGSGKTAATAAGVLIGSIVGDNIQNGNTTTPQEKRVSKRKKVRVCTIEEKPKRVITGYEVVFEHGDVQFSEIMARKPGNYIDINVEVEVLENYTGSVE